ncbi:hypothetical protein FGL80_05440 [Leuconostoc lactis]|uniref:hypothetical protein n=1 Tax=Leuconostoc lactis TaxID=1246 RepID=UPI000E99A654|nr:hypothetical protein [Leuconostoc lactis]QEA47658.1 hypothetical protein FGL80_05440 [Leuconostoc lactis]HBP98253.1 hypothetical protein [Leuconostoc lactis]
MKKTLLLSATAAILAGAFAPAVFADTTSPSATTAGGSMSAVVATDNVMPIVSGTTNYDFGNINYAWNAGKASLTQGSATPTGSFSVQNLKTQLDWKLSATYSDNSATDANGNQAVVIPDVALKAASLTNYATTTVTAPNATLNLANGTPSFTGTVAYTIAPANVQ